MKWKIFLNSNRCEMRSEKHSSLLNFEKKKMLSIGNWHLHFYTNITVAINETKTESTNRFEAVVARGKSDGK